MQAVWKDIARNSLLLLVFIFVMAIQLLQTANAAQVNVCYKQGEEHDLDASYNANTKAKLTNPAYFGSSGNVAPETINFIRLSSVTSTTLTSNNCQVFYGGGGSPGMSQAEATTVHSWLYASSGRFMLSGCDYVSSSYMCNQLRTLVNIPNGGVTIDSTLSYNPIYCGGVLSVGTYGGVSSYQVPQSGDVVLATHNATGSPSAILTDSLTSPKFLMTADADMFGSSGASAIGAGATATTDQAKFILNSFKFAIDEAAGRPHYCIADYNASYDYGDAPTTYGAPSHEIVSGIHLGSIAPDSEATAQPNTSANLDDTTGTDDEDAITSFPTLKAGATSYSLSSIPVTNTTGSTATLYGWIDVNLNGRFDGNEVATANVANGATSANLSWSGLTGVTAGSSYVRLRLTTQALTNTNSGNLTLLDTRSDGTASNGEVEDYALSINTTPILASPGTAAPVVDLNGETQGGIIAGWSHHTPTSTLDADFTFTDPNTPDFGTLYFTGADPAVVNTSSSTAESLGTSVTRTFVGDNTIIQVGGVSLTSYTAAKGTGDYIEYRFTTSASLSTNAVIDQLGYGSHPDYGGMNPPTEPYKFTVEVSDDNFTTSDILVLDKQVSANSGSYEFLTLDVPDYSLAPSTSYTFRIYLYDDSNADGNVIWDDFAVGVTYDPTDHENTFTEGGPAVDIADVTTSVEDADDTDMSSANIVLTNAFSGDFFVINGTVTSNSSTGSVNGLNYLVTESGGQITLSLSGTASKATYATVINLIQFDSSATPINTTDRIIHVTVNDGSNNSNTAISTIHVTATPTVVSSTSCPSGTVTSAVNILSNGNFAIAPDNTYIYPAGDDGLDNATPGFFYANASFYSQARYRGFDVYPSDTSPASNGFSIIQDTAPGFPQVAFPGDPSNNAPASPYWFYSNGNRLGVGDDNGGPTQEYLLWEEDVSNLVIGKTYSFVAYVSNVLEGYGADEPIVRLRVDGTTGMPDGTVVFGPYNIPEAATANSQPLNGWQRIEYTFTASATSMKFKFTSAAKSIVGDDFGMTAMGVHECIPIATYDYGDAPVSGSAPDGSNTNAYGEAIHTIASGISLGAGDPDADTANQPTTNADGDDTDGTDDEDGVTIPTLAQGQSASIDVTVNQVTAGTGYLQGWIDWNGDGDFADAGEQIATDLQYSSGTSGTISIPVSVPVTAITNQTYARFRWSTTPGLDSTTATSDGEVEDYALTINSYSKSCVAVPVTSLGNAYVNGNNEYILTDDVNDQSGFIWSNEKIDLNQPFDIQLGVYLGSNVGIDPGTGLDSGADGMSFVLQNDPRGTAAQGYIGGHMGVDGDINLSAYGYTDRAVYPSLTVEFDTFDNTFMGFTGDIAADHTAIYLNGDVTLPDPANTLLAATSVGTGGEIEDGAYHLTRYVWNPTTKNLTYYFDGAQVASVTYDLINYFGSPYVTFGFAAATGASKNLHKTCWVDAPTMVDPPRDFSDIPLTGTSYGATSHIVVSGIQLGVTNTSESNAYDTPNADGDTDDGITLPTLVKGQTVIMTAAVAGTGGYLQGWIDWNGDGDFADTDEQIATNIQDNLVGDTDNTVGVIKFNVAVPATATLSPTFARFRWSSTQGLDSTTAATNGEVEDYAITIIGNDYGDAPGYGDAAHSIDDATYMGTAPDVEAASKTTNGDASDDTDDGVFTDATLTTGLQGGTLNLEESVTLHIPVTGTGKLYAWIDWNQNGDFSDSGEQVATSVDGSDETLAIVISVPLNAQMGTTYARFRFSDNDAAASVPTGTTGGNGEVEDYQVIIANNPDTPTTTAQSSCSGTWSTGGGGYQSTTAQGVQITATTTAGSNSSWSFAPNDALNTSGTFSLPDFNGAPSLSGVFTWDTSPEDGRAANAADDAETGTLTFSFSTPVKNPVIHVDRLGGYGGNSSASPQALSNSVIITPNATNASATFTELAGTTHFEVTSGSIQRTPNETLVWGESTAQSGPDSTRNTAMGSVQINGTYSSLAFDLSGVGVEGAGADGIEFVVCAYPYDYGDAPDSYGDADHRLPDDNTVYLGTVPGEGDNQTQNSANGSTDGSGDDNDGTDDEDGVANFPILANGAVDYSLNVVVNNTSGSTANLIGWIDFNRNGLFDSGEAASISVASGANNKVVALTWNSLPGDIQPGSTYLRLRLTTDSSITTSTPAGTADDGEVEDYSLVIGDSGYTVTGTVYHDTNVDGNNAAEDGIQDVTVVLYDTAGGTCRSTKTGADGSYQFTGVQPAAADNYVVYEAADEDHQSPAACPPVATDPNGYVSSTANTQTITVSTANVSGVDFGDVKVPTFTLDNTQVILPNTTVAYPHIFRSAVDGSVTFSLADSADPSSLEWGTGMYLDNNCDAALDAGDTAITGSITVSAGDKLCILTKVLAPANATAGAGHTLDVTSSFTYGDGSIVTVAAEQTRTDITKTSSGTSTDPVGGEGKLSLVKSVWNATRGTTVGDNDGSVALPGEILRYTIRYENIGNGQLDELVVHDSVPAFTQLGGTGLVCGTTPSELSACTPTEAGGSLDWTFTGQLLPGSSGDVYYEVVVE